jgi:Zn finger protein HypA/HybF involved in hydrogenase expression
MNFVKKIFSLNSSKGKINEKTTETKKCWNCLRRIKVDYVYCPHCSSKDFVYDIK